jgi:uncharacterized phage protein (TIGR02216 family)
MGLGFSLLRLTPEAFWAFSPREFFSVLRTLRGDANGAEPPARGALDDLMARYPDIPATRVHHA